MMCFLDKKEGSSPKPNRAHVHGTLIIQMIWKTHGFSVLYTKGCTFFHLKSHSYVFSDIYFNYISKHNIKYIFSIFELLIFSHIFWSSLYIQCVYIIL